MCVACHTRAPAKAVGRNEMPFGRDTPVAPGNIVLDRGPDPHGKGRFGELEAPFCKDAIYCQITLALVMFYSWLSMGIAPVSKESFKKFLDPDS